ncbi:MAG: alpha/beta fold hydrolase [Actinomycetota bacterium]|nr:alpha/beta fold hydrolase [Actinomycetota bacterium]
MQQAKVLDGAEEFGLGQGPVGALLVHGFTGSPQSMRGLGEFLATRGIGVTGVRLPGHGTTWEDLNSRTSDEWVSAVDTAFDAMLSEHDEVFVIGLSFGVALALELAARNPQRVSGVVCLAGFIHTPDPRRYLAPLIRRLTRSVAGVGNDICDPDGREICYDRVPTSATVSMLRFIKKVRADLPKVTAPLLVIHSPNDHTAHPSNATMIHDRVSSTDKELVWLERSYHVITLDYEKDQVLERTYSFIKERAKSAV